MVITTGATPLALPGGMGSVTLQHRPTAPLYPSTRGTPKHFKPRTRHEAIRTKAFGPAQMGKAFNKA